ncbi:hypothetical protein SDC9_49180 [bioreactor metagenome]|uniref:Secretion system C-terminal sorting domain-containing protein n=1 Tax=bioreactor metagenome TaxID=1076179 RepID=A0A644WGM7_9ZZZZ
MKRIYILFALLLSSGIAFSQIANDKAVELKKMNVPAFMDTKAPTDTCGWSMNFMPVFASSSQVYIMGYSGGGYVYGNNVDGVNGCAQGYAYTGYLGIEGVLLWFGEKNQSTPTATMTVSAYALNGTATNDPSNTVGPGSVLGTATLTMNDADTTWPNLTWVPFASVIPSNGDFACGVDFSAITATWDTAGTLLSGDEIGLLCDEEGDAYGIDYAFHKYSGTWYVTDYAFGGLDRNIAIFPVVDINYAGLNEDSYFYGMQSNAYPIPASDNMTIEYALENNADVTIEIIAGNGQTVAEFNQGNQVQGQYSFQLNVSDFNAGHYFFSIKANGHRLIKSFIVQ